MMQGKRDMKKLFKKEEQKLHDFSQGKNLIKSNEGVARLNKLFSNDIIKKWWDAQKVCLTWTKDKKIFPEDYVGSSKLAYDAYFKQRGLLKGKLVDVGGGWGLFRQWWKPGKSDFYIVHDPGIERFLRGPHKLHYKHYKKAFGLPMSFVEGYGEKLPYKNNLFDTWINMAALDHCIDTDMVMKEAYRVLKPKGTVIVIQRIHKHQVEHKKLYLLKRLLKHLPHPRRLLYIIYNRLVYKDEHLHHFEKEDMVDLLKRAGFSSITTTEIPNMENNFAFEGRK